MIDDHERIEELLAGYVLRSLSGADASEADLLLSEHVPGCGECRRTLDGFQVVTADLGFAVEPVRPPETLLPRLHRQLEPHAPRRRPMQMFAVAAGVVAVVGLAGLTVSQNIRANNADVRADAFANAAQLAARDDARMVDVGPVQEISAPGEEHFYLVGEGVPGPPAGSIYRVWLVSDGVTTFVGDFLPDELGRVFLPIDFDPNRYDDLWIAVEPIDAPTGAPVSTEWWSARGTTPAA
ncbi:MAG: anti-sigma factor [Actinomycetota bacterium]|nr:anti-sigma factor [Actinomycetota bacterium]MDH5223315.1 anti-sigma factor [Actinomycetota bacterium]MDH5313922.1 anti-sigma factor [Actinomycetota bacterium]